jgi:hypothetical protein
VAAIYKEVDGTGSLYYAFTDYQSSLIALTDADGDIASYNDAEQRFAYDPWGNRRDPDDWTSLLSSSDDYLTERGYALYSLFRNCFGKHLSDFSLINMNLIDKCAQSEAYFNYAECRLNG